MNMLPLYLMLLVGSLWTLSIEITERRRFARIRRENDAMRVRSAIARAGARDRASLRAVLG